MNYLLLSNQGTKVVRIIGEQKTGNQRLVNGLMKSGMLNCAS